MLGLVLLSIILVSAAAVLVARALTMPRVRTARVLGQIETYGFTEDGAIAIQAGTRRGPIEALGAAVARSLGPARVTSIRRMLIGAGLHTTSVERYLGLSAISVVVVPLVFVWLAISTAATPALAATEIIVGIMFGCLAPHGLVARRARFRLEKIDREIPELVDLLLVAVEGGMAFSGAIRATSQRVEGPLGEELLLFMQQQSLGASTTEALQNFLDRCDTDAVRSFVLTIVQGERLGVSIGQLMRTLAEDMRKHRRATAEEKAQKMPIKILFPLVFMILPAMFIVVLTPAIANLVQGLSDF
jgi:tight adherence protein C